MSMSNRSLAELQADFRAGSTNAMPIAGMVTWAALGVAAAFLPERTVGDQPLTKLFLLGIVMVALTIPIGVIGAKGGQPLLVLLTMAILAGVVWIPYAWAADDPSGIIHAVARGIGCYLAYGLCPAPWTASAICAVVVLAYIYSLKVMRPTGASAGVRTATA